MTVEEKVGQLFVVGFEGPEVTDELRQFIIEGKFSGFILFKRNIETVEGLKKLTKGLRSLFPREQPPILAADEEGGRVTQIGHLMSSAPSAATIGRTRNARFALFHARDVGQKLKWLGFNVVFAPVLDVNDEPSNPVIGDRSYGDETDLVSALGVAAVRGFQDAGVAATAKHFPGHGSSKVDSHKALPVIRHPSDRWYRFEFVPFQTAIEEGVRLIMTAHVACPGLTQREDLPATFSPQVVDNILREKLGFDGVVITDALEMAGAEGYMRAGTGPEMAILAGCDLLLFAHGGPAVLEARNALVRAVKDGRITEERLQDSLTRISRLRAGLA